MKRVQHEQIRIAGDQRVGFAVDGDIEEFVVARIAAGVDRAGDCDATGDATQQRNELPTFVGAEVGIELGAAQHDDKLGQRGVGNQQDAGGERGIDGAAGVAPAREQATDEDVGIDDPTPPFVVGGHA